MSFLFTTLFWQLLSLCLSIAVLLCGIGIFFCLVDLGKRLELMEERIQRLLELAEEMMVHLQLMAQEDER